MKQQPMARKLLALCLSLLLVFAFVPTAWAEGEVTTQEELENAINRATGPTVIQIADTGVTITQALVIDGGKQITLTGGPITAASNGFQPSEGSMIYVKDAGTELTVACEVAASASSENPYRVILAVQQANLTLEDGANIHGGYAVNTTSSNGGGGVRLTSNPGTFTMNGGSIHDNFANIGGGLSLDNHFGPHMINGGTIVNNTADQYAGGVWVGSEVKLSMTGGNVTGNQIQGGYAGYENSTDIMVNSNRYSHEGSGLYVTSGTVTANVWVECGNPDTDPETSGLYVFSGGTLVGNVTIPGPDNDSQETVKKISNQGTIDGEISLGSNTLLDNTGTIDGTVTAQENAVINNNGTGEILGGVEGTVTIPEGSTNTITASAGSNGTISPSGTVSVKTGESQTFTITAVGGYNIQDVKVDGTSVGAVSSYTFDNVFANHTIAASFVRNPFTEPAYYPDYDEDVDYLPPVDEEEPEEPQDLYMVTCRTLNVRLGGGTGYAKIGTLSRGTIVSGELENGWLKFTYNDQTAYCSADYLAKVGGDLTDMHVTCRTLNVRAGAGTNFAILGTLSRGTEVEILDVLNGWYKIEYLGGEAYVSAAYIG